MRKITGKMGEDFAVRYLQRSGVKILQRNFRYNHGEIDIVANDGGEIVFVEVKTRRSERFGTPQEGVTPRKQTLLRRTAEGYVLTHELGSILCRFDVVAICVKDGKASVEHFKNAF